MVLPHRAPALVLALSLSCGLAATLAAAPAGAGTPSVPGTDGPGAGGTGEVGPSVVGTTLSRRQAEHLLRTDDTVHLDRRGRLYVVDPVPPAPPADAVGTGGPSPAARASVAALLAPAGDTFALHSRPGAERTIFLDVDGTTLGETAWGLARTGANHPAWDPAGDGAGFSATDLDAVQKVWASVAADFEAFDVDVTTQDPGSDALVRSSASDTTYGIHVVIGPSPAWGPLCSSACGGVAYVGTFPEVGGSHQPAWVFTQGTGNSPKSVAEAASHEVGHTLGLGHDGTRTSGYYTGLGLWAPIMGVGYYRPVTQWSRGSYYGATNRQDDVTILRTVLGSPADEAGPTWALSGTFPEDGTARITSMQDKDAFALGACTVGSSISVSPTAYASNLDLGITLRTTRGLRLTGAYQVTTAGDGVTAAGTGASVLVPAPAATKPPWGDLVLEVTGAAESTWSRGGYDAYGSIGQYEIDAPGCNLEPLRPAPPVSVAAAARYADTAVLTWEAGTGGDLLTTGYRVSVNGGTWRSVSARAVTFTATGLRPGAENTVAIRSVNGVVPSETVEVTVTTPPLLPPGAPGSVTVVPGTGQLALSWARPAEDGGAPLLGYELRVGGLTYRLSSGATRMTVYRLLPGTPYAITLRARNKAGYGDAITGTVSTLP
ncbi:fibronectin type III domain-containing protein [Nocardioides bruguierae]|uniref:fibronectin type III domain-containing protein n=1 Tax=Nocardioides bruguierae TaxID=2945102 RepID=UPI002020CE0A|nr:fibronectin type III domain-containing protein [Nocardioides bruguierae]MCL8025640.1 fibronectin type III domain-containing protein [Nocardioides bruguierae]